VIDNQADRDGSVFPPEQSDVLSYTVFVEAEILLAQVQNIATMTIANRCVQDTRFTSTEILNGSC